MRTTKSDSVLLLSGFAGMSEANKQRAEERYEGAEELIRAAAEGERALTELVKPDYLPLLGESLSSAKLERLKEELNKQNIQYFTKYDVDFPVLSDGKKRILYVKGRRELLKNPVAAIVGSRNCTEYAKSAATEFARELSRKGVTVVSGLAEGVDGAAHAAALRERGGTIAVLGCGIGRVYPRCHENLQREIGENGLLISGYPCSERPKPYMFAERNFLIADLCEALVLIEAGEKSGSLITAGSALSKGRRLFVVTGSIFSEKNAGGNSLIERDPQLATVSVNQVLAYFQKSSAEKRQARTPEKAEERTVLSLLQIAPMEFEELLERTGMEYAALNEALFCLEIEGYIEQSGNIYKEKVQI